MPDSFISFGEFKALLSGVFNDSCDSFFIISFGFLFYWYIWSAVGMVSSTLVERLYLMSDFKCCSRVSPEKVLLSTFRNIICQKKYSPCISQILEQNVGPSVKLITPSTNRSQPITVCYNTPSSCVFFQGPDVVKQNRMAATCGRCNKNPIMCYKCTNLLKCKCTAPIEKVLKLIMNITNQLVILINPLIL